MVVSKKKGLQKRISQNNEMKNEKDYLVVDDDVADIVHRAKQHNRRSNLAMVCLIIVFY